MENVRKIPMPVIGVSLLIMGIMADYYVDQYNQTYQLIPEASIFSYASLESQEYRDSMKQVFEDLPELTNMEVI